MPWGRQERLRARGLVIAAPPPYDRGDYKDDVTVAVRPDGGPPIAVKARTRIDQDVWLVRGTSVTVEFDPSKPNDATLEDVPSLKERIAAGDPALVDPIGAARAVAEDVQEIEDAAAASRDVGEAARIRDLRLKLQATDEAFRDERRLAVEAEYGSGPLTAPDGRWRGFGRVVSLTTARPKSGQNTGRDRKAIWAIQLIGQAPYATVLKERYRDRQRAGGRFDIAGAGAYPLLVNPRDRDDIEILWQEAPDATEELLAHAGSIGDLVQRQVAAMAPEFLAAAFAATPDAASKRMLAEQLRAQGMQVDDAWVTGGDERAARLAKLEALLDRGVLTQAEYDEQVRRLAGQEG